VCVQLLSVGLGKGARETSESMFADARHVGTLYCQAWQMSPAKMGKMLGHTALRT